MSETTLHVRRGSASDIYSGGVGSRGFAPATHSIPSEKLKNLVAGKKLRFNDLELFPTVGTGAFGRVRMVKIRGGEDKSPFALKMLKKSHILKEGDIEHVKQEVAILIRLSHPFIVNLFTYFQDDRRLCILMEYVNGGELFTYLNLVGQVEVEASKFYASQIVLILQYVHSKEIVYRDLKPENLLLDADGNLKLADFGFAHVLEGRAFTLCGTPEYMAPEIIQAKGHGKPVDWWALGVLIFEMLAGESPFYDRNPFGVYQRVMAACIVFPSCVNDNVKDLIRGLLRLGTRQRMGKENNGDDIKAHQWFTGVDWQKVHDRQVKPPYIPNVSSVDDTSMFDPYDESDGEDWEAVPQDHAAPFEGFELN